MKILFLDLDGVICTTSCYGRGTDNKWGTYRFDSKCVSTLNFIIQETGCEIILSSDWRFHYTLQEIREIFEHNGVIKGPIGFTPRSKTYTGNNLENGRSDEIKMWLEHNAWKDDVKYSPVEGFKEAEMVYFTKIKALAVQWHPEGMDYASPATQFVLSEFYSRHAVSTT